MNIIMDHLALSTVNQEVTNMGTILVIKMETGFACQDGVDHTAIYVSNQLLPFPNIALFHSNSF